MTDAVAALFAPVELGALVLPNRVVMAPMTRNRAGPGNVPSLLTATYYAQRATAGLIVTEAIQPCAEGQGYPATPGLHTSAQVDGWRAVTAAVQRAGGRIVAQLCHAGRISHSSFQPDNARPVAPSALAPAGQCYGPDWKKRDFETPTALDPAEIAGIAQQFATAAAAALSAGFDGVEIHAGNGYLVDQFLRDGSNRRADRYGGAPESRVRFLAEVAGAVVAACGGGDRVGVRFSPWNSYNDMADSAPERLFPAAGAALADLRLAYVHVVEPAATPQPIATAIAAAAGSGLIVNGGYDAPAAARLVTAGRADAVSFGKPFIANPDFVGRIAAGQPLAEPDRATTYGGGATGYTDYPAFNGAGR